MSATSKGSDGRKEKEESRGASWNIWKACDELENKASTEHFYPSMTAQIVEVVRELGRQHAGNHKWRSLLDKGSLRHELEESTVVLHHVIVENASANPFILVDACGGKGLLSLLFSCLKPKQLQKVVLLEKMESINWHHIHCLNQTADDENRPIIEIWSGMNLHDYDHVLYKIRELSHPVYLTGIHLCKQLGPSFCGLVNGLGKEKCPFACLAPCCLPRIVTTQKHDRQGQKNAISVQLFETFLERQDRIDFMKRKTAKRKKTTDGPCFLCHCPAHCMLVCPDLAAMPVDEQVTLQKKEHAARVPCWQCFEFGHGKADCPKAAMAKPPARSPPCVFIDVSKVLKEDNPFETYCQLLGSTLQERTIKLTDSGLKSKLGSSHGQEDNWNGKRKGIYMMIT